MRLSELTCELDLRWHILPCLPGQVGGVVGECLVLDDQVLDWTDDCGPHLLNRSQALEVLLRKAKQIQATAGL